MNIKPEEVYQIQDESDLNPAKVRRAIEHRYKEISIDKDDNEGMRAFTQHLVVYVGDAIYKKLSFLMMDSMKEGKGDIDTWHERLVLWSRDVFEGMKIPGIDSKRLFEYFVDVLGQVRAQAKVNLSEKKEEGEGNA